MMWLCDRDADQGVTLRKGPVWKHLEEDATLLHLVERRDCDALQYFCPTFIWEVALG